MAIVESVPTGLMLDMLKSGMSNLYRHRSHVNSLNVFPVPDGDTGSNMYVTLRDALKTANDVDYERGIFGKLIRNAILSGRGNSGAILSMFLKGFLSDFDDYDNIDRSLFLSSFMKGCNSAKAGIDKPVEGTIITVMDAAGRGMMTEFKRGEGVIKIFENGLLEAEVALKKTPDMLPVLKKANVVDAGGQGFLYILQGMYEELVKSVKNKTVKKNKNGFKGGLLFELRNNLNHTLNNIAANINVSNFNGFHGNLKKIKKIWNSEIEFKYDVEFTINKTGKEKEISSILRKHGNSIIIIETDVVTKVHVHTNEPKKIFEEISDKIGDVRNKTVEDMDSQRNDVITKLQRDFGIVVLIKNYGFEELIKDFGVENIFQVENPSVSEIANLIKTMTFSRIIFLVSDKNLKMVVRQAFVSSGINGEVLSFDNEVYLLNALMNYDSDGEYDTVVESVRVPEDFKTVTISSSAKECDFDGKHLVKGEYIALVKNDLIAQSVDISVCLSEAIMKLKTEHSSLVTIYRDETVLSEEDIKKAEVQFEQMEFEMYNIGKANFIAILSVE